MASDFQIKSGTDVHYTQCPTRVTRRAGTERNQVQAAHVIGPLFQLFYRIILSDNLFLGVD